MIPCGQGMSLIPKIEGYEVTPPVGAMLPPAHVQIAPYLLPYLYGTVVVFNPQLPGTSLKKNHARRGQWRLHYISHHVQACFPTVPKD